MEDPILQMSYVVYKETLSMSFQICHTLIVVFWDAAYGGGPWGDTQILQGGDAQAVQRECPLRLRWPPI